MRVKKLAFLSLFICVNLFAQPNSSYFLYDKRKLSIPDQNFKRYALAQLRAMMQEYYHLLRKLHPVHSDLVNLKNHVFSTYRTYEEYSAKCDEVRGECADLLKGFYIQSRKLDRILLELQGDKLSFKELKDENEISSFLRVTKALDDIGNENYKLLHAIEEYLITANTHYFPYFDGKKKIFPFLHKIKLTSEMTQTFLLEGELKQDFDACWNHFFRPVEYHIIYKKDKKFLINRLEELNISWNTFHMKMTKGNHNLPKNLVKIIKIMHNRWNSVLKLILRN